MHQREAMWIEFKGAGQYDPVAVKIGVGKVNAISGRPWSNTLEKPPSYSLDKDVPDYLIVPKQPWLDGIQSDVGGQIKVSFFYSIFLFFKSHANFSFFYFQIFSNSLQCL